MIIKQDLERRKRQIQLNKLKIKIQQEDANVKLIFGGLATLLVLGILGSK